MYIFSKIYLNYKYIMDANKFIWCAVIVIILIIIFFYYARTSEHLGVPFFLDQMAMTYPDPTWFNYLGYERDVSGMSQRDYYLENQMNASTGSGPQYLEGNRNFKDHTDYMDMPIKNRPMRDPTSTALQIRLNLNSNNLEELVYSDLN